MFELQVSILGFIVQVFLMYIKSIYSASFYTRFTRKRYPLVFSL